MTKVVATEPALGDFKFVYGRKGSAKIIYLLSSEGYSPSDLLPYLTSTRRRSRERER